VPPGVVERWSRLHGGVGFTIADDEVHCLQALALNEASDEVACLLLRKLAAAKLVNRIRIPLDVVALNCIVEFIFGDADEARRRLVHPHAVSSGADLSVISALGAGLIGLRVGQAVQWPDDSGVLRCLRVLSVTYPAGSPAPIQPVKPD
jgi:regulator of nucleoside diphosphate kinase